MSKFVIHPRYIGRDKGAIMEANPAFPAKGQPSHFDVLTFETEADAERFIRARHQPGDTRCVDHYMIRPLEEYREYVRRVLADS